MNGMMIQIAVWLLAGGLLLMILSRRRKRKTAR
jgi:hypothetical protein